ncbi:putative odorant receptor 92a [Aricia agestis]|uniref:putative odorant receptor 92a n=1 Tax=Aricia agestis TaxID=91739 RepID=UPI001C20AC2D|nr:putative odorant receptor 92a [Aricia agestis]
MVSMKPTTLFLVSLKGLIIIKNKRNVEAIVDHLGALWTTDSLTPSQRERKTSFLKRLNVVRTGFYWSCLGASWQNLVTPLFLTALQHEGEELQLPFGYVLPFQLNLWTYLTVYIFQCYTMLRLVYIYLGTELLKIVLCAYLSIEFMLLQEEFKCVSQESSPEKCSRDATLMASNLTAVSGILFPIYIYCYYSAVLGEESSGVADAVYEDLWYQGDMDYQKTICFIIARSQYPCYLKALKSVPLTVLTFTRVVSTTWSYLSLAISLYSE